MPKSAFSPFVWTLLVLALTAPARASEFSVALDGNFFNAKPLDDQNPALGARVGGHAALDITLFSSQFDWRLAGSFHPFPDGDKNILIYGGPQLRFSPQTNTGYLGLGLGLGASETLGRQGIFGALASAILPFRATFWGGYRFADPGSSRTQNVEGYGTGGVDGFTVGLRWGFKL